MKYLPLYIAIGALILAAVALLVGFNSSERTVNPVTFGNTSIDGSQSILPNPSNTDYDVARLALGLGTNLSNSSTGAGNVVFEAQRANLTPATTTPCSIQNPFNATSTLLGTTLNVTTATSTSASFVIATSTSAFANTSIFFGATLAANALGSFAAGESATSTGLGIVIPPTGWVTYTLSSANTLGGTCTAVFQSI